MKCVKMDSASRMMPVHFHTVFWLSALPFIFKRRQSPATTTMAEGSEEQPPQAACRSVDKEEAKVKVEIEETKQNESKASAVVLATTKKLFVANLHHRVAKVHLEKLLQPYGTIIDLQLAVNKSTGQPRGYAFCEYATLKEAAAAISALHGRTLLGRNLVVQCSKPKNAARIQNHDASTGSSTVDRGKLDAKIKKLRKALNESR